MLLRNRVTLIALATVIAASGGLAWIGQKRERLLEDLFIDRSTNTRSVLWDTLVVDALQPLDIGVKQATADSDLMVALRASDLGAAASAGLSLDRRHYGGAFDEIEIYMRDGQRAYPPSKDGAPPLLNEEQRKAVIDGRRAFRGMVVAGGRAAALIATPLVDKQGVIGGVVFAVEIARVLEEMKRIVGNEFALVTADGTLLSGTDPTLWEQLKPFWHPGPAPDRIGRHGGRYYVLLDTPHQDISGKVVADQVAMVDYTETQEDRRQLGILLLVGMATLIVAMVGFLWFYLRRSFALLDPPLEVLNRLAHGDASVSIEPGQRDDEISRIATAVESLRRSVLALNQMRQRRKEDRHRQAGLIRAEMTSLAGTLEEEGKEAVLAELATLEAPSAPAEPGSQAGDEGLDLMAAAFQNMSQRVREQQGNLKRLVAELQEALKSENELIALHQELEIARQIQQSTLPEPMQDHHAFEIAGRMVPAQEVGGDFYDFFRIDERRIGIVVADVSDKGVPAAFVTGVTRVLLRATAQFALSPAECLNKLNNLLWQDNRLDLFVTLFYGVFDITEGRLDYANAGHNPPRLLTARGAVSRLESTDGLALAVLPDVSYKEKTVMLSPGDSLFFFTDGVTEALDPAGNLFTDQRLDEALAGGGAGPLDILLAALLEGVAMFAGGTPQADDITCVMMRYRGTAAEPAPHRGGE